MNIYNFYSKKLLTIVIYMGKHNMNYLKSKLHLHNMNFICSSWFTLTDKIYQECNIIELSNPSFTIESSLNNGDAIIVQLVFTEELCNEVFTYNVGHRLQKFLLYF